MRKLANGVSNYEKIVNENRIYVDKTKYIEKLENLNDSSVMFLRPRKFGKTLFTSVLENYYDVLKKDDFERLFKNTYIYKNPTSNRNRYYILRFNFSGIDTSTEETCVEAFKNSIIDSIQVFIYKYSLNYVIDEEKTAEEIFSRFFIEFGAKFVNEKIYVIIDEYDHFANELLGFNNEQFKHLVSRNGKIRKWYEVLKKGTETVVDRIFITGVAPITLDSTTSGFNIAKDLTKDLRFNDMLGFCEEDIKMMMNELEIPEEKQKELLPIMKRNYDGYVFSNLIEENIEDYRMYNSNMVLYFLNEYVSYNKVPKLLIDTNIISDYSKIEGLMNLCKNMNKIEILEKIVAGEYIDCEITEKYNSEINFDENELISLLFYLGYLTIGDIGIEKSRLRSPNDVIKKIYTDYFLVYISRLIDFNKNSLDTESMNREILFEGKLDLINEALKQYLTDLSNRDYRKFNEKYVQVLFYALARNLGTMYVKTELEVSGKYSDILMVPLEKQNERYGILIEFKYIKKEDFSEELLEEKKVEARKQLDKYKKSQEVKLIPKLKSYIIVAVKDELYVEEH